MQFLGADIDITGQDIIHDDVLDEGAAVMLFLVEGLGIVEGYVGNVTVGAGSIVITHAEHSVLQYIGVADNSAEGLLTEGDGALHIVCSLQGCIRPALTQKVDIGTGNHTAVGIDDTKGTVAGILKLQDHALKNIV